MKLPFFATCVDWRLPVSDLQQTIDSSSDITRNTFLKYVDRDEMKLIENDLGYEQDPRKGLTMKDDYHVRYHRSTVKGCPAVFFVWSATEFVFTDRMCVERAS